VVRDVGRKSPRELRDDLNAIKKATRERSVKPEDMRDFTFTLSNFGMMAGRYATPVIVPPTIAILGAGGLRHDVVAVMGGIETHPAHPPVVDFRPPLRDGRRGMPLSCRGDRGSAKA
jgi:2-oxoisovalerate dehydrogenase E2 component (dihydrolipoyl transacylase)